MPPIANMAYGEAPAYCFPVFEFSMYILFVLCLLHAINKSIRDVSYLIAGTLFGLLLEYINVLTNQGYVYGKFMIMLGKPPLDIPLCIGVGWGIIMYTARLFTDTFKLPLWASACLDTLLALSIDISMDTIAYRLHMWTWDWKGTGLNPLTAQWFGIPYGNFSGWIYVVFFFSLFSRLLQRWLTKNKKAVKVKLAVIPLLSVLLSQVALWVTMVNIGGFLRSHGVTDGARLSYTLLLLALVIIINWRKKGTSEYFVPLVAWLVPAWFHVYFFAWLFIGGFYKESNWLAAAGAASLLIGLAVHVQNKKTENKIGIKRYLYKRFLFNNSPQKTDKYDIL